MIRLCARLAGVLAVVAAVGVDATRVSHHRSSARAAPALQASGPITQDLTSASGLTWVLTGTDSDNKPLSVSAVVPGNVYPDLVFANVLQGDPLARYNEKNFQWVAGKDWTYTTTFDLNNAGAALQFDTIQLEADGIDTIASISLNGWALPSSDNMHLQYVTDVKSVLKATGNKLVVVLSSPTKAAAARAAAYPYEVPRTDQVGSLDNGNFIRKAASDFGWDWGPAFAGSGIWLPLRLVAFQQARVVQAQVHQIHASSISEENRQALGGMASGDVALKVQTFLRLGSKQSSSGQLCVSLAAAQASDKALPVAPLSNCTTVAFNTPLLAAPDLLGQVSASVWLQVPAASAQLWWPAGYGAQPLSNVQVTYTAAEDGTASSLTRTIAFKTVELVRETGPEGQNGASFYYRINDVPIFIKGANMIPFSSFHGRDTSDNATQVLQALLDAGGNTVRVWGGGNYAQDVVYEYASRKGLLIWQEFSFACAMYPRNDDFLASVRKEVAYQTRRLASYGAMMVFGGNNENESALDWFDITKANRDSYLVDYVKLYLDTVRDQLVNELNGAVGGNSLPFVSSSPSRGPRSEEPYTQMWGDSASVDYGDMHYYNYEVDCTDISKIPRARFVSEFGFQSLPSLHTLAPVLDESDYQWNGTLMTYRQRHGGGNQEMLTQIERYFHGPDNSRPAVQAFTDWLYLTQAMQALCYSTAIHHWRRIKQETPGRTMGTIYWQLNDLWQGPTWSSIEYGGRWKQLHSVLQRSYAPLIATGYINNSTGTPVVNVYVTSDINAAVKGTLTVGLASWAGDVDQPSAITLDLSLDPLESTLAITKPLGDILKLAPQCAASLGACFMQIGFAGSSAGTAYLAADDSVSAPQTEIYPVPLRQAPLKMPKLALSDFAAGQPAPVSKDAAADQQLLSATFTLTTDAAAAVIVLDTPLAGRFSANSFVLRAGQSVALTFYAQQLPTLPFTLQQLQASLTVRSIRDTYSDATAEEAEWSSEAEAQAEETDAPAAGLTMLQHRSASNTQKVQCE